MILQVIFLHTDSRKSCLEIKSNRRRTLFCMAFSIRSTYIWLIERSGVRKQTNVTQLSYWIKWKKRIHKEHVRIAHFIHWSRCHWCFPCCSSSFSSFWTFRSRTFRSFWRHCKTNFDLKIKYISIWICFSFKTLENIFQQIWSINHFFFAIYQRQI